MQKNFTTLLIKLMVQSLEAFNKCTLDHEFAVISEPLFSLRVITSILDIELYLLWFIFTIFLRPIGLGLGWNKFILLFKE
jgi:hypothetical protein